MAETNKRNPTDGFSSDTMSDRLDKIKKYSADWRRVEQRRVVMTNLVQTFRHIRSDSECNVYHICPWGMREYMTSQLSHDRCKQWSVLPAQLKQDFPEITSKDVYRKEHWELTVKHSGPAEPRNYYRLFCSHCQYVLIPQLVEKYRDDLGSEANVDGLIAKWDELKVPSKFIDYVGCFLPYQIKTHAGPCSRKYIRDQSEHPKTSHPETMKKVKRPSKSTTLAGPLPEKIVLLEKSESSSTQTTLL